MILSFSMKIYNFLGLIQIWVEWHMDGCPFRFAFKYGFNLPAKVLAYSNEKQYKLAGNCLTVDTIWFDLM